MTLRIIILILLISSASVLKLTACDCEVLPKLLEAINSDIVFEGQVVKKSYSSDSLEYTVYFKVDDIFKNVRDHQDTLYFTKPSEKTWTSCDSHIELGQRWLVYGKYGKFGVGFSNCSNSRALTKPLTAEEQELVSLLPNIDLSLYRFSNWQSKNGKTPLTNVDSLLASYSHLRFENQNAVRLLLFDLDQFGNTTAANFHPMPEKEQYVELHGLRWTKNLTYHPPQNKFDSTALEIANKITKWEPFLLPGSSKPVRGRTSYFFVVNENGEIEISDDFRSDAPSMKPLFNK